MLVSTAGPAWMAEIFQVRREVGALIAATAARNASAEHRDRLRVLQGELRSASDAASAQLVECGADVSIAEAHLAGFHPTGTARMGADPEHAPVDTDGRLRGVHGVYVADASVLPTCPEVNPQLTIMAMALAVAENAVTAG